MKAKIIIVIRDGKIATMAHINEAGAKETFYMLANILIDFWPRIKDNIQEMFYKNNIISHGGVTIEIKDINISENFLTKE